MTANTFIWISLLVCSSGIVFLLGFWYIKQQSARRDMIDDEPEGEFAILNSKVEPEKDFVVVRFGKHTIQLSFEQWLIWKSWDRKRKRIFVRDTKKVLQSQTPPQEQGSAKH